MSNEADLPAQRVVGRYALFGEIAAGGMATVHFGRLLGPVGFARTVAIKRLHAQFAKDPEFVSMFLDEARVAARIQHPNVVSTLDVVAMSGELFLVMEYVQGESLGKLVRLLREREESVPTEIAGSIIAGSLYGLHAAHEAKSERGEPLGIIHRDVSPQNVLVGTDGVARVLDFGVAKAAGRIQTTRDGQLKGKIAYMPPEQLAGMALDRRTDVYAASVVLWELLTNRRLFSGEQEAVIFGQVLAGADEPPSVHHPGLPDGVDDIVMKGLSKDPKRRYQTAHDMAVALEDALGHASPRKVGEWVDELAGRSLEKRAARVKEIESISTVSKPPPAGKLMAKISSSDLSKEVELAKMSIAEGSAGDSEDPTTSAHTAIIGEEKKPGTLSKVTSVSISSIPGMPPRRKGSRWLVALVALLIGGAAAVVAFRSTEDPIAPVEPDLAAQNPPAGPEEADSRVPPLEDVVADEPEPEPDSEPEPDVTAEPAVDDAVAAPAPTAPVVKPQPRPPKPPPAKKPPPTAPPPPPAAPKVNCSPPYTVDASGIRRIKPECL